MSIFSLNGFGVIGDGSTYPEIAAHVGCPTVFLGYPHGLFGNYPDQNGFLTPLAKIGYFSGVIEIDGVQVLVLDGINNPGFSGGPIFCCDSAGLPTLMGIINGYRFENHLVGQLFKRLDGDDEPVKDYYVRLNSGIIYATFAGRIDELSKELDVGDEFRIKQA